MAKNEYKIKTVKQLQDLAQKLLRQLKRGSTVGLRGELGSGKTTFVKHIAKTLGIKQQVISPTFIYHQVYKISNHSKFKFLHHLDLYRIRNDQDLTALGLDIELDNEGLSLIEWVDNSPLATSKSQLIIDFTYVDKKTRLIKINKSIEL